MPHGKPFNFQLFFLASVRVAVELPSMLGTNESNLNDVVIDDGSLDSFGIDHQFWLSSIGSQVKFTHRSVVLVISENWLP